jgi:opacity protein-like surface antigen
MSVAKFVQCCAAVLGVIAASHPAQAADYYGGYRDQYGGYKDQPYYGQAYPAHCCALAWQGFYVGGNVGGAWSSVEPASNVVVLGGSGIVPVGNLSTSGFLGGFQLGYNIQAGNFVYGIEADFGGIDTGVSGSFAATPPPARVLVVNSGGGFYGDITGRAGYIVGNALIYAKGGFAFFTGSVRVNDAFDGIAQNSGTFTGWTIGAGVEYYIAPQWTLKVEYQFFDFDNNNFSCCTGAAAGRVENAITSNTVKLGFNFFVYSLRSPLY